MEEERPTTTAKRLFNKKSIPLSTSRSTPTLNDLVHVPLSKRKVVDLSISMRRGSSQQATQVSSIQPPEQPKKET